MKKRKNEDDAEARLRRAGQMQARALERYAAGIVRGELPGERQAVAREVIAVVLREKAAALRQRVAASGELELTTKPDQVPQAVARLLAKAKASEERAEASDERAHALERDLARYVAAAATAEGEARAWRNRFDMLLHHVCR